MPPKISSAEWEVMNAIWSDRAGTAVEIFHALPEGHGWKQRTVNTFLARLVEKGVLKVDRSARPQRYEPLFRRDECVADEGESFLQRVVQGATGSLVLHFAKRGELTDEEIRELERLLKARKGGRR